MGEEPCQELFTSPLRPKTPLSALTLLIGRAAHFYFHSQPFHAVAQQTLRIAAKATHTTHATHGTELRLMQIHATSCNLMQLHFAQQLHANLHNITQLNMISRSCAKLHADHFQVLNLSTSFTVFTGWSIPTTHVPRRPCSTHTSTQ